MADITLTTQELQLALDSLADGFGEFAKILDKSGSATTEVSTRKQKQDEEAIKKVKTIGVTIFEVYRINSLSGIPGLSPIAWRNVVPKE